MIICVFQVMKKIIKLLKNKKKQIFFIYKKELRTNNMLSVNYIANFLNKDQKQINNRSYNYLKDFEINNESLEIVQKIKNNYKNSRKESYTDLYDCFEKYFEKEYFGFNKMENKNKNNVFTFFSAIFFIGDESYYVLTDQEKSKCIKNLIHI